MKKRILIVVLTILAVGFLTGCSSKSAKEFKESYEALNGTTNKSGKEHRSVKIDSNNPFEKVEASEIVEKINNKESFYVYFGDELCPWCRSVIEKFIEVANKNNIKKVYYVKIWDKEGTEILRSKYELDDNNELKEVIKGTDEYYKLLESFNDLLSDYTLTDKDGNKVDVHEKRIFAPNFVYVKDGVAVKLVDGISDKQKDAREELTKEMLTDEEKTFNEFFNN